MSKYPKMTRAQFELIAQALLEVRSAYSATWDRNLFRACDDHAKILAKTLALTNIHFNRERFLRACGVQS